MSRHLKNKHPSMINEAPKYSTDPSNTTQESSSFSDNLKGWGNSYANQRNIQSTASDIGESNCVDGLVSENVNASEPTPHDLDTVLRKLLDNLTTNRGNAISNIGPTQSEGGLMPLRIKIWRKMKNVQRRKMKKKKKKRRKKTNVPYCITKECYGS